MRKTLAASVVFICLLHALVLADTLDDTREVINRTNQVLKQSQKKINTADAQTMEMLAQYKAAKKEIENYQVYNRQLSDILSSQVGEMDILNRDIDKIEATGKEILPFMQKMIDGLERFVASDLPFLPEERHTRIRSLKDNMKRADLSTAEKFRQILEAFQIEIDYGKTIEAYDGIMDNKKVVFLKIGRIGLYYMTLDKTEYAAWHKGSGAWKTLEDMDYRLSVAKAIQIAKKQKAPDLFFAAVAPAKESK